MQIKHYVALARPSHWFKNVFMVPGLLLVLFFDPSYCNRQTFLRFLLGFAAACLIASSNYVLNEILDARKDAFHPEKKTRPFPRGDVRPSWAYAQWVLLAVAGFACAFFVAPMLGFMGFSLWVMGGLYNIPPVRLKDIPYADVLSESVNNPIRMAMGWYATGYHLMPPLSALLAYWMFGAFLMAMKRFAEYRMIDDPARAASYRESFGHYNQERLIESLCFYGALFGMMSGVFMARYRIELVLATPLVAYTMAYYMHLGFKPNSPVQYPEQLYRQNKLLLLVGASFSCCAALLYIDFGWFKNLITPWVLPPS